MWWLLKEENIGELGLQRTFVEPEKRREVKRKTLAKEKGANAAFLENLW